MEGDLPSIRRPRGPATPCQPERCAATSDEDVLGHGSGAREDVRAVLEVRQHHVDVVAHDERPVADHSFRIPPPRIGRELEADERVRAKVAPVILEQAFRTTVLEDEGAVGKQDIARVARYHRRRHAIVDRTGPCQCRIWERWRGGWYDGSRGGLRVDSRLRRRRRVSTASGEHADEYDAHEREGLPMIDHRESPTPGAWSERMRCARKM
jgi:hypothetical protein